MADCQIAMQVTKYAVRTCSRVSAVVSISTVAHSRLIHSSSDIIRCGVVYVTVALTQLGSVSELLRVARLLATNITQLLATNKAPHCWLEIKHRCCRKTQTQV